MIEVTNIHAFYGKKPVLTDVSLSINEGDRCLLIGPNGAGKSTLLKVIAGLDIHSTGTLTFSGTDVTSWSVYKRIKSGIGYLLQSENIIPGLTVKENLFLGGYSQNNQMNEQMLEKILTMCPLMKQRLTRRAGLLSGGERQALAIGMVLMKQPKFLMLDEPSAGLSPSAASEIIDYISIAENTLGIKAICMVEHNLKLSLQWANKLVVLVEGKIKDGSKNPGYYFDHMDELERFFFNQRVLQDIMDEKIYPG